MTDDARSDDLAGLFDLVPVGLICGGLGTPLQETWVDLGSPSQVFYGLNGAGKTTVLESLHSALSGRAPGGKLLARIPFDDEQVSGLMGQTVSMMLHGTETFGAQHAHEVFLAAQRDGLLNEFTRRHTWNDWDIEGSKFDELDWNGFLDELAASELWIFSPIGADKGRWSASPVVLIEPDGKWSEHLKELTLILNDDGGPVAEYLGFDLLWWENTPDNAPVGIVGTLIERLTERTERHPWWPFGRTISDQTMDISATTRHHLANHQADHWITARAQPLLRGTELIERVAVIEQRANVILSELLAGAPALRLQLGDDADWFAGRSCSWSATRFDGERPLSLSRLSSAELRWAQVSINLALSDDLNATFRLDGKVTSWLILDEPERGLHRTAEAHMASGVRNLVRLGLRSAFATHSPELLDNGAGDVSFVRRRSLDRAGAVVPLRDFNDVRSDLGLNPSDMLRRTRGIALVEGEHDLEVLSASIGAELAQLGVTLLATRGGSKLKSVVDSRFLYDFTDAVLFPILDDMALAPVSDLWDRLGMAARVRPASEVITELHDELRKLPGKGHEFLGEFLAASVKNGTFERVQPLGIPQTDVLLCLPVAALVPGAVSWEQLRDELRRDKGGTEPSESAFKEFLRGKKYRADLSAENVRRIAANSPTHPDIKALLASIAQRLSL